MRPTDIYRKTTNAGKNIKKGVKYTAGATAEFGTVSVKAVGKAVKDTAGYVGSTSLAQGAGYLGMYGAHGLANALEAGIPGLGGFVANKVLRGKDTKRLLRHSPIEQDKKLEEYNESYDLSKYKALCKETQKHLHESASSLLMQRSGDRMDLTSNESIGKDFEASKNHPNPEQRKTSLTKVNEVIGKCIPKTKLTDIQKAAKKIIQGIEKGENPSDPALADPTIQVFHRPQEVVTALEELYHQAQEELAADRKQALANIENEFAATPTGGGTVSDFKRNLARLLGVAEADLDKANVVDPIVAQQKNNFIKHVEDSYKKAEEVLKSHFEDKKDQKDKDGKSLPDEQGILTRATNLKQACEYDLLVRIAEFERRNARGADFPGGGLRAGIGGPLSTPPNRLKNRSVKEIRTLDVNGWILGGIFGKKKLENSKTSSGTDIEVNEQNGEISFNVPGLAFPYHVVSPNRLQEDFEEIVERVLANKEKPEIEWKIQGTTDDLRNKIIVAAYKASLAKNIDPKNIIMTVKGGGEKQNFVKKPIDEIIAGSQPPIVLSQEDINFINNIREKQRKEVAAKHEPANRTFKDEYKKGLENNIKPRGIEPEDDDDVKPISTPGLGG